MPNRARDYPLASRGVYAEDFTVDGRRGFYAVNSAGEGVAYRTVSADGDPAHAIGELWDELNRVDPIPFHDVAPTLRTLRLM